MIKNSKIIGICKNGIDFIEKIDCGSLEAISLEQINENIDVGKEYVRKLLDDTDILYTVFTSEDKRALDIVKAIGFMASERKVLCIGLDVDSSKSVKIEEIDRCINLTSNELENTIKMFDMISASISDEVMINIDITDLRDIFITEKGIRYSYVESDLSDVCYTIEKIKSNMKNCGDEFISRKCIAIISANEGFDLSKVSEIMEKLEEDCSDRGSAIFAILENRENPEITVLYN